MPYNAEYPTALAYTLVSHNIMTGVAGKVTLLILIQYNVLLGKPASWDSHGFPL